MKIEDFTNGQIDLLKAMVQGCNISLYRNGQCRLRDSAHNPLRNVRLDLFEKVRPFLIQINGLFYLDSDRLKDLPDQIKR